MTRSNNFRASARPIRVEIDERPLNIAGPNLPDYVGRIVGSAITEPLLRPLETGLEVAASEAWKISRNGLRYEFIIRNDRRWSSGEAVMPEHFVPAIKAGLSHPLWRVALAGIRQVQGVQRRLIVELAHPNSALPWAFATPDLGPSLSHKSWNGPFRITRRAANSVQLEPNYSYPGSERRSHLVFCLQREVSRSLRWYDQGRLDVTCNTAFPYEQFEGRRAEAGLHVGDSGIYVQLEPGPGSQPALHRRGVRQALYNALDLEDLAAKVGPGLAPARSFGPQRLAAWSLPLSPCNGSLGGGAVKSIKGPLRILYHPYYPNRRIVELIAASWQEQLKLRTQLVPAVFDGSRPKRYDLALTLSFDAYLHPIASLVSVLAVLTRVGEFALAGKLQVLLRALRVATEPFWPELVWQTSQLFAAAMPVLPIGTLRSIAIIRPGLEGFAYPHHAQPPFHRVHWR